MKSCKTCVFALDYEFSPACEKCFHHSNWLEKVKAESIPMTNGDHIRSMSDEEMADFFWGFDYKDYSLEDGVALTKRQLLKWFKQPKEKEE